MLLKKNLYGSDIFDNRKSRHLRVVLYLWWLDSRYNYNSLLCFYFVKPCWANWGTKCHCCPQKIATPPVTHFGRLHSRFGNKDKLLRSTCFAFQTICRIVSNGYAESCLLRLCVITPPIVHNCFWDKSVS